jgi:hypothetical protein
MGNYWRKVFARAWADTKQSFGWNQKTAATILGALALVAVAFLHFGFAAMLTSAIGLFWTALPIAIAGLSLFVWNFFSVPAALHTELSEKIAALESTLAELKEPPLDYAAVRHIDRLTLREAAFYWCDLPVGKGWMPSNVATWCSALQSAITKGELDFEPAYSGYRDREREREHQKSRPHLNTVVKRTALQTFAKRHGYDPKFLRNA